MFRRYKYRLWTNANQEQELEIAQETHRRLWNAMLAMRIASWECDRVSIDYNHQQRCLTWARKTNPYLARLNAASAQHTLRRLDKAYQRFFRRVKAGQKPGFPRFKGRHAVRSLEFTYGNGIKLTQNKLYVQHVGTIRVKLHRPVEGTIKTATLKREAGKWYVVFSCELPDPVVPTSTKPPVGIDVGLEHFLTTSDGEHVVNPRYLREALPALRRTQRAVSRKHRDSTRRRKAGRIVQKLHARVRNLRREHAYKTAHLLVLAYGLIAVESLNIRGMLKNDRLARAISDAGWAGFLSILRHVAENAGAQVVEVDPRGTSQQCICGAAVPKTLSQRRHDCPSCGLSCHRDIVSAQLVLLRGLAQARIAPAEGNVAGCRTRSPRSRRLRGVG